MRKIKISFVASTFAVGGSERVMSDLITRLPVSRFDKKLYFLKQAGEVGRALFAAGIGGAENLQKNRFDPGALIRLVRFLRRDRPDILFVLDHRNAMLWGRLAGVITGVPSQVLASHSTGKFGGDKSFGRTDRWLMRFTDRVVALSRTHSRYLVEQEGIDPGKISIIENGIDVEAYARITDGDLDRLRQEIGLGPGERAVIMVALMRPEKAHESLLAAAELLTASFSDLKFLVVGDGPRRPHIEDLCVRMGLGERVKFMGVRNDVARLLHAADVLVLPSHASVETLPMAVLEAMAAGLPVVASRVGSIPEVIEHEKNGLLIKPADPRELAAAVERLLNDRETAEAYARAARETVETRFSVDRMVDGYIGLFESLTAGSEHDSNQPDLKRRESTTYK